MKNPYILLLVFSSLVFIFLLGVEIISSTLKNLIIRPSPSRVRKEPYESGMIFKDTPYKKYGIRIFPVLLLFLLFDVEVIILFPWAIEAKKFGLFALFEAIIFIAILFIGYVYILKKGGLDIIRRK